MINSSANACEVDDDESDEVNAEEALEAALEQLLDAEMAAGGGDDELDSDESDDADEDNVDIFIALSSTGKRSLVRRHRCYKTDSIKIYNRNA